MRQIDKDKAQIDRQIDKKKDWYRYIGQIDEINR